MLKFACAAVLAVSIVANAQATPLRPTPAYVATTMKTTINHRAAFAGTPGLVKSITCTELATRGNARKWLCAVTYKNATVGHMTTYLVDGKLTWGGN